MIPLSEVSAGEHRDLEGYWLGLRAGELRAPRCRNCGRYSWPPRPACPWCKSKELQWELLPAHGRIFPWTVVHHTTLEEFKELIPYTVALIEITSADIRVIGHVRADPAAVDFGQSVTWVVDTTDRAVPGVFWIPDESSLGGA